MKDFGYWLTIVLGILCLIAIWITVCGYCIMLLWNWLMPDIFGLSTITFWQAIGIDALISILFLPGINLNNKN